MYIQVNMIWTRRDLDRFRKIQLGCEQESIFQILLINVFTATGQKAINVSGIIYREEWKR